MIPFKKFTAIVLFSALLFTACNKEKKLMEGLIGNWNIEESERAYLHGDGSEEIYETLTNAGKLIISEDAENPSETSKHYKLTFIDSAQDTLEAEDMLITDEKNKRIILLHALNDSTAQTNMVWTIEKEKKNQQVWSLYGTDSTFFYPAEMNNPGAATNSLVWRIKLKRE
ncbi:MAG: hypothetical protein HYZ14_18265 [Bacteroidetes bacterium]|nr:hypothetical protein [Bacteroidota bacterium]